jgi:hypothetical protein
LSAAEALAAASAKLTSETETTTVKRRTAPDGNNRRVIEGPFLGGSRAEAADLPACATRYKPYTRRCEI